MQSKRNTCTSYFLMGWGNLIVRNHQGLQRKPLPVELPCLGKGTTQKIGCMLQQSSFRLCQWFSALLMLGPFSTVSHVMKVLTHIKLFLWRLHNYNLPNVKNCNINILGYRDLQEGSWLTGWGSFIYVTFLSFEHHNSCRKCNDVQLIKTQR